MNARVIATKILLNVIEDGVSLSDALVLHTQKMHDARDQALVRAICFGVCRWYFRLDAIANQLLNKPLKAKDIDIHILILIGLYQLMEMRIPDYAAVGETVNAVQAFKKLWAKNLVNGVLREYQREAAGIHETLQADYMALYSHPQWLMDKLKKAWPNDWREIMDANNQHPPFALRVNQKMQSREAYVSTHAMECESIAETTSGIILHEARDVHDLPGFDEGMLSVQDGAAQLAAVLLMLEPNQRVLDACAAPGGKTTHILEVEPQLNELIAVEKDAGRLSVITENLQRLKLEAECVCADVGELTQWWDQKPFDRILLDVPCSATGVIRRHPDIKLLRRETDFNAFTQEQLHLLTVVWEALKPGGLLLYSTCSIFPDENEHIIEQFLEKTKDAKEDKIEASWGQPRSVGRQIIVGQHEMDGFYYARLRKC